MNVPVAFKKADPTEGPRFIFDYQEAREIDLQDPSIIVWLTDYSAYGSSYINEG